MTDRRHDYDDPPVMRIEWPMIRFIAGYVVVLGVLLHIGMRAL